METQKTLNSQKILRKKSIEVSYSLVSNYTTNLQSSKQYGASTETDTQINGTE